MKARVKSTGEIVEARRLCQSSQGPIWEAEGSEYYEYELDFDMKEPPTPPYDPDYWTRLEHQYAGMAMQGILSNPKLFKATAKNAEEFGLIVPQTVAIDANCFAHALVQKLKEKEERK